MAMHPMHFGFSTTPEELREAAARERRISAEIEVETEERARRLEKQANDLEAKQLNRESQSVFQQLSGIAIGNKK
jgi:hypothetical protein